MHSCQSTAENRKNVWIKLQIKLINSTPNESIYQHDIASSVETHLLSTSKWILADASSSSRWIPSWTLLLVLSLQFPSGFWQNCSFCHENNMPPREFLLKFTNNTCLQLLKSLQLWWWNVNYNSFLPVDINFFSSNDVQLSQMSFQIWIHFKIQKSLKLNKNNQFPFRFLISYLWYWWFKLINLLTSWFTNFCILRVHF